MRPDGASDKKKSTIFKILWLLVKNPRDRKWITVINIQDDFKYYF